MQALDLLGHYEKIEDCISTSETRAHISSVRKMIKTFMIHWNQPGIESAIILRMLLERKITNKLRSLAG